MYSVYKSLILSVFSLFLKGMCFIEILSCIKRNLSDQKKIL